MSTPARSHPLLSSLSATDASEYLILDANLVIVDCSPGASRFAGVPDRVLAGEDSRTSFPELAGLESSVQAVLKQQATFELKGVDRAIYSASPRSFNLSIVTIQEDAFSNQLVVLLEEASPQIPSDGSQGPDPTASPSPALIDSTALEEIQRMVSDDAVEFVVGTIDCYLEESLTLLQALQDSLAQADLITLRRSAHTLRSTSLTLGATALAQRCEAVELMALDGALVEAAASVSMIAADYPQVVAALQLERQRYQQQITAATNAYQLID